MNFFIVMFCFGLCDFGLMIQVEVFVVGYIYYLLLIGKLVRLCLLMLMVLGDVVVNILFECLFEVFDIDLVFYYFLFGKDLDKFFLEYDVLFVVIGEFDDNCELFDRLMMVLVNWLVFVINVL